MPASLPTLRSDFHGSLPTSMPGAGPGGHKRQEGKAGHKTQLPAWEAGTGQISFQGWSWPRLYQGGREASCWVGL